MLDSDRNRGLRNERQVLPTPLDIKEVDFVHTALCRLRSRNLTVLAKGFKAPFVS